MAAQPAAVVEATASTVERRPLLDAALSPPIYRVSELDEFVILCPHFSFLLSVRPCLSLVWVLQPLVDLTLFKYAQELGGCI